MFGAGYLPLKLKHYILGESPMLRYIQEHQVFTEGSGKVVGVHGKVTLMYVVNKNAHLDTTYTFCSQ